MVPYVPWDTWMTHTLIDVLSHTDSSILYWMDDLLLSTSYKVFAVHSVSHHSEGHETAVSGSVMWSWLSSSGHTKLEHCDTFNACHFERQGFKCWRMSLCHGWYSDGADISATTFRASRKISPLPNLSDFSVLYLKEQNLKIFLSSTAVKKGIFNA